MTGVATIHADMRAAFRGALQGIADLPSVVGWEGKTINPNVGVAFMTEGMVLAGSEPRAIGHGGTIQHKMLLTVNLYYPANTGTLDAELAAGRVMAALCPGTVLTYDGQSGTIMKAEPRTALTGPDFLNKPVVLTLIAYTAN